MITNRFPGPAAAERIMNWRPLLTCAFTENEFIVLRNSFGFAPYLP